MFLCVSPRLPSIFIAASECLTGKIMRPLPGLLHQLYHDTLRRNLVFKQVNGRYEVFPLHVFNRKEYGLEIYSQSLFHLFLPLQKREELPFLFTLPLPSLSHLPWAPPALSIMLCWVILDSLAVWHCQPRYWICILFTLSQSLLKGSNNIYLFLIFLPVLGHRSLISMSIFMAKTSVNIFSKLFHVCQFSSSNYSRAGTILLF